MEFKRDDSIDFIKGILVLCVIYGHVATALKANSVVSVNTHTIVRLFDMPFFSFISGYFIKFSIEKKNIFKVLFNKTRILLFCAYFWNIVWDIIVCITTKTSFSFDLDYFWFLWSIYYASCIVIVIGQIYKYNHVFGIILFIFALVMTHIGYLKKFNTGYLLYFCGLGFLYAANKESIKKWIGNKKYFKVCNAALFVLLACFWDGSYSIWKIGCNVLKTETVMENCLGMMYRGLVGLSGIILMNDIFSHLYNYMQTKFAKIAEFISKLGKSSLPIYILQTLLVEQLFSYLITLLISACKFNFFIYNVKLFEFVIIPAFTLILSGVIYLFQVLLKKTPILKHFVFGVDFSFFSK